ncbi:DUF3060 domain-containing protein [Curtobacterium sp. NPDC087082]|uniref:DUF3060 domain-containing protein n=1 Tax=Curtobacterium sp. NPDC087082 TaxID=3363966 RepID=UPI0037F77E5D
MKKLLTATLSAAALVTLLAGCSTAEQNDAAKSPAPTTIVETEEQLRAADTTGAYDKLNNCVDGMLTVIDAAKAKDALAKGCETVRIVESGATMTLGPVEHLSVEGADNTITASTIGEIAVDGEENSVSYTGEDPEHLDDWVVKGTEITKK